jgi:putative membrane protein
VKDKFKISWVFFLVLIGVITCIHPIYPNEQLLQHAGTLLLLIVLLVDIKKDGLSHLSFSCISLFTLLHIIAARYLYSFVPYNDWFKFLLCVDLNAVFHATRNHFDRFVHFSFGALAIPVLYELFDRKKSLTKLTKVFVIWCLVQTFSMFYEIFEWLLTLFMTSESADYYNGQQGDMWDAQKDMVLAMLGSSIICAIYLISKSKSVKS